MLNRWLRRCFALASKRAKKSIPAKVTSPTLAKIEEDLVKHGFVYLGTNRYGHILYVTKGSFLDCGVVRSILADEGNLPDYGLNKCVVIDPRLLHDHKS